MLQSKLAKLNCYKNSFFDRIIKPWNDPPNNVFNFRDSPNVKVLANEDTSVLRTVLLMMFLGLRKLGNICCGHKMFLNKIGNIFCVPDTNFVSATNVACAGKRGNMCWQQCVRDNVSSFARAFRKFQLRLKNHEYLLNGHFIFFYDTYLFLI